MIVALLLPERSVFAEDSIGLVDRESFERPEPLPGCHARRHEQMDVIRHHHEGVQLIPTKPSVTIPDGIDDDLGDCMLPPGRPDHV